MGNDAVQGPSGWLVLGCGTLCGILLPAWLFLTATLMQMSPELRVIDSEGETGPTFVHWLTVGWTALWTLGSGLPLVLLVLVVFSTAGFLVRRRTMATRRHFDRLVEADAVIADPSWSEDG